MSMPTEKREESRPSPGNEGVGRSSDPQSSPEQSIDVSPPTYGAGAQYHTARHLPYHQAINFQQQAPVSGYMSQGGYPYHTPSSPTAMQNPYVHPMVDVSSAYGQSSLAVQDVPQRSMSPGGTSIEPYADPYFVPYMQGGAPLPPYYVQPSGPPPPHSSYAAQSQYQGSGVYGMQYYAPYTQPQYYNAGRGGGWAGVNAMPQHGWRQASYFQYQTPPNQGMSSPGYVRGGGLRPRPMPQAANNQGTLSAASRSTSTSSRTSPGSTAVPTKQTSSPNSGQTSTSDLNAGSVGSSMRITPPQSQNQGPRSEHVLWCGNVPADATVDELWAFFAGNTSEQGVYGQTGVDEPASDRHGVISIFIISRSNCAFVNYETDAQLRRALLQFQGRALRPDDLRCPKLVCRVRKKDDEAQAGVAGQRGRGIHVAWLKEQERRAKEGQGVGLVAPSEQGQELDAPQPVRTSRGLNLDDRASQTVVDGVRNSDVYSPESTAATPTPQNNSTLTGRTTSLSSMAQLSIDNSSSSGSVSYASTNSSLFRHPAFRERFFILKSLRVEDLDASVQSGTWATQTHNEAVLDQAYRNSESVYLIFSANQSGGFYGYARMTSAIHPADRATGTSRVSVIPERDESEEGAATLLGLPTPQFDASTASPLQMTPSTESEEGPILSSQAPTTASAAATKGPLSALPAADKDEGKKSTLKPEDIAKGSGPMEGADGVPSSSAKPQFGVREGELGGHLTPFVEEPSSVESDKAGNSLLRDDRRLSSAQLSQRLSLGSTSSEPLRRAHGVQSPSSSEAASLAPSESASYPADARAQGQLAIRALIHNLRLDEKESYHRAKQLEAVEAEMKASEASGLPGEEVPPPQPLASSPDTWGKSFKIEWIKVQPLDFQRVRKLRNPWRDNRQIKVSRDGTELEPNVGRQLLEEWQKAEEQTQQKSSSGDRRQSAHSSGADEDEDEH